MNKTIQEQQDAIKDKAKEAFGLEYAQVNIDIYNVSSNYYTKHDNIFDRIREGDGYELLEFSQEAINAAIESKKSEYDADEMPDEQELEESARHELEEALAYWTIYFKPCHEDEANALKAGLTPFTFDGEFYLALGGCGMDLSPRLEAYQALCDGTISRASQLDESNREYFEYVAGKKLTKEIIEAVTLEKPRANISFDIG